MTTPLDSVRVAAPCSARWEDMQGDDRRRLCGECGHEVHDLSALSRAEAEDLLRASAESDDGACVRLWYRADGRVLTSDCPVGLRAVRRRARLVAAAVVAGVGLALFGAAAGREAVRNPGASPPEPVRTVASWFGWLRPTPPVVMGRLVCTPPNSGK